MFLELEVTKREASMLNYWKFGFN